MEQLSPCIRCGTQLEPVDSHESMRFVPSGGTLFQSDGNYGSTVWDEPGGHRRYLEIVVCDNCIRAVRRRVSVVTPSYAPRPLAHRRAWNPALD